MWGDPVNTFSGAFYLQATDISLASGGPALQLDRSYVSRFADEPIFPVTSLGPGWRHSYEASLTLPSQSGGELRYVIFEAPTGNRLRFSGGPTGPFRPLPGVRASLSYAASDATYTLTAADQQVMRFDAEGRLIEQRDTAGRTQTLSYYDVPGAIQDGKLAVVTDTATQRSLTFTYQSYAGQARLKDVTDSANRQVSYLYTAGGFLREITDLRGEKTAYTFDGASPRIKSIIPPDQIEQQNPVPSVINTYDNGLPDGKWRVSQQVEPSTTVTTYDYDLQPDGLSTTITRQRTGQPVDVIVDHYRPDGTLRFQERNGAFQNYVTFDSSLAPTALVDGAGNVTTIDSDPKGNPIRITDALTQTTLITYTAGTNRPDKVTDPLGRMTIYTYDGELNLTAMSMGADDGTGKLLSSEPHFTTVYTYNVRYPNKNWLEEQRNPDNVVTRYSYDTLGQTTEVVLGYGTALSQTTRYGYDAIGRVITTTVGYGTPFERRDVTNYNPDNTITSTVRHFVNGVFDPQRPFEDVITRFRYDALGRQVAVTDAYGVVTATHYDTQGRVDWTIRNLSPATFDAATGLPVLQGFSPARPDENIATFYAYDHLGRVELVTETGILTGTFSPATRTFDGHTTRVTKYVYDSRDRVTRVIRNFKEGAAAGPDVNVETITYYDGAGNVTWQRDSFGRWTKIEYDDLSRPEKVITNYENGDPLTVSQANTSWATLADTDLISFTEYAVDGQVKRTVENFDNGVFSATQVLTDRVTLFEYDRVGRPLTTTVNLDPTTLNTRTDTNIETLVAHHRTINRVIGQRDPLGRWVNQQYDALSRPSVTTLNCRASNGLSVASGCAPFAAGTPSRNVPSTTRYDTLGRPFEQVDVANIVTRQEFDILGRTAATIQNYQPSVPLSSEVNVTTRQAYDALGRTTVITDAVQAVSRMAYDALGRTTVITDAEQRVTTMGYDGTGAQRWTRTPDGRFTVTLVDGLGRVVTAIANYQNGAVDVAEPVDQDVITRTVYDVAGRRVATVTGVGRRITGGALAERETRFTYDLRDLLLSVTENTATGNCPESPCNVTSSYTYDRAGNRISITDANGHTRTFKYDAADQMVAEIDAMAGFDAKPIQQHTTGYEYDRLGRLTKKIDPRGTSHDVIYTYDELDRPAGVTSSNLDAPITMAYDQQGRQTSLTDVTGTTSFTHDALGRIKTVDAPATGVVSYGYNARGDRTSLTYPGGVVANYTYYLDGQLQTVAQGSTNLARYRYDAAGRLIQVGRGNTAVTNYRYDNADQLQSLRTIVRGAIVSGSSYQYDRLGMRTAVTDTLPTTVTPSSGRIKTLTFEADALVDNHSGGDAVVGTVALEQTNPLKERSSARVNGVGSSYVREDITAANSVYVSMYLRVDALPSAATQILAIRNGTTTVGNLALTTSGTLQLRNGTTVLGTSAALTPGTLYRVAIRQTLGTGSNAVLAGFVVAGDTAFGSAFHTSSNQTFTTQATQVWVGATGGNAARITFDDVAVDTGAIAAPTTAAATRTTTYTYDGLSRLTSAVEAPGASYTYTYDLAGNRTDGGRTYNRANQVQGAGWSYDNAGNVLSDGTTTYTYDALSRTKTIARAGTTTTNTYNGDGTLVKQVTGSATTLYTQDLAAPLSQVLQVAGASTTTYLYGHERLANTAATRNWYLPDGMSSLRRVISDSGSVLATASYDPWGTPQSTLSTPFGFTGELHDAPSGQVYLRARWYDTASGRFPAYRSRSDEASVYFPYSYHPYAYSHSNPVNWTDPSGKCLGWMWGDPNCQFAGTDYTKYDYAGAGQVVVTGLGVAGTVVACAGTAGVACAAGAAGAAGVASWGNRALDNAGMPVAQAATQVDWRGVAVDTAIGAASGPVGYGAGRMFGPLTSRIAASAWRATVESAIVGAASSGSSRLLTNAFDGDPNTSLTDGLLSSCFVGAFLGGATGRVTHSINQWWLSRYPAFYSAQGPEDIARLLKNKGIPWPTGARHGSIADIFGPGLYTFRSEQQAIAYMNRLMQREGAEGIRVLEHRISAKALASLRTADLTRMTDDEVNAFFDLGVDHGYEHVSRMTGNYGIEDYFRYDVYHLFRSRVK